MARMKRPTKVPGFDGTLPSGTDKALAKRIDALTEAVDIRLGRRGDPQDRAITLRELIESGLAEELRAEPWDPNNPSRGNIGIRPAGFADVTVPPAPTGVSASGGFSLVQVYWDFPTYLNHSLTEIWRYDSNTIGNAILVGTSGGRSFVDPVGEGVTRYYWVRHVSESSIPGPFHATNGASATTALNVALLLSTLNGAITTSQLTNSLLTRINLIDGSSSTPGTIPYQIAQEAATRATALGVEAAARAAAIAAEVSARDAAIEAAADTLQGQINDIITVPAYDNGTAYVVDDLVQYNGNLYRCILASTGNLPTNATYWELLGAYSSLAEVVSDAQAAIVELNNVSATSGSANASALYALQSTVDDPDTGLVATRATIATDYYTSAETDEAIAESLTIYSTTAQVNTAFEDYTTTADLLINHYTKSDADAAVSASLTAYSTTLEMNTALEAYTSTADLTTYYYTRADTNGAISTALNNYVSATALNIALGNYTNTATLTTNHYTKTETNSAISGALTTYVSETDLDTALDDYTNTATLTTNYYTITETNSAISGALQTYVSETDLDTALDDYTNTATLTTNYYTITETNSAISGALTTYVSETDLDTALEDYTSTATLTTNYYTITETNSAISGSLQTYVSTLDLDTALEDYSTTAAIETSYYTIASAELLEAQYMVKLDVNGRVSGFGLYSDSVGSEFTILADRFAIVSPLDNGMVSTPFIVQATSTTVGGVSVPAGIYINDAVIMNGTITNAKIKNATIEDSKIANLSANKITTGLLDTSRLIIDGATLISEDGVLKIGSLSVDNLSAGLITADKIVGGAINSIAMSEVTTSNSLPTNNTYEAVNSLVFEKEREGDSYLTIDFEVDVTATGSGAYALQIQITRDGTVISRTFSFYMTRSFAETVQGRCRIVGAGASTSTYAVQVKNNISNVGFATCTVNSSALTITEVKR